MKRAGVVMVLILSAVSVLSFGSVALAGRTEWDCQYTSKLTVRGQFSDTYISYGEIYINENRKKWEAYDYVDDKVWHYSGTYRFMDGKTRIRPKFSSSSEREYKRMLKYWIKKYAREYGVNVRDLRINIKTLRMSKPSVLNLSPLKFSRIIALCKGTVKAKVDGKSVNTEFVHKSKIKIID